MLDAITASGATIESERKCAYRVAALLHDVGHYPYSHTTEHALKDFYSSSMIEGSLLDPASEGSESVNHEQVGGLVLENDEEISAIVKSSKDVDLELLKAIFSKTLLDPLFGIISSELDCDRLDYLGRTSYQSGVPFGQVDVEFIISKSTVGPEGELAFDRKASKAIDHLLVGRYYDYMQMVYHKTVEGLEWSLTECIKFALKEQPGLLSKENVRKRIAEGTWWRVDDSWLVNKFKGLEGKAATSAGMAVLRDHLAAVLYRRPAKRVWKWESLRKRTDGEVFLRAKLANSAVKQICSSKGIDRARFFVSDRKFKLVKLHGSDLLTDSFSEERARSIRIRGRDATRYLVEDESLLLHQLSEMNNFAVNVYYLPAKGERKSVRDEIRDHLAKEMG